LFLLGYGVTGIASVVHGRQAVRVG
jgi:hypothetical protein